MSTALGHHQYIPLSKLTASPLNHRKRCDQAKMAELTASVLAKGVVQPIIARPLADGFEVVAGERRFRAAKAAKLLDIPAVVRKLTDAEVLELQVIENGQREDPHPLEDAEGYEALLQCKKANGEQYTVDDIAAKTGKSRSFIFARLKLCALCPEGRKAFYDAELDASRALLIARIGHHDTQRQALKDITKGIRGWGSPEPMSYCDAHKHIVDRYMLKLSAAPFDIKDAQLVPKAGDCGVCPKRTGNLADLFGDVKGADVCTDPKCFDEKRQAHYLKAVKELEAKGKKVIYGDAAKKAFPNWDAVNEHAREGLGDRYIQMSHHTYIGNQQRAVRDVLGKDYEALVIQHPGSGKLFEVATRQALESASKKTKRAGTTAKASSAPKKPKGPDVDEVLTERLAQLIHKRAPKDFNKLWVLELARLVVNHLSTRDLDAVALAWGWRSNAFKSGSYSSSRKLPAEAEKLGERDLILLMFHMVFAIGYFHRKPVLKLFGINEDTVRELIIEERKAAAKKAREEAKAKSAKTPTKKINATAKKAAPEKTAAKKVPRGKRRLLRDEKGQA